MLASNPFNFDNISCQLHANVIQFEFGKLQKPIPEENGQFFPGSLAELAVAMAW